MITYGPDVTQRLLSASRYVAHRIFPREEYMPRDLIRTLDCTDITTDRIVRCFNGLLWKEFHR